VPLQGFVTAAIVSALRRDSLYRSVVESRGVVDARSSPLANANHPRGRCYVLPSEKGCL